MGAWVAIKSIASLVFGLVVIALFIGLYGFVSGEVIEYAPPNATVVYKPDTGTFATPPCILKSKVDTDFAFYKRDKNGKLLDFEFLPKVVIIRLDEARSQSGKIDPVCQDEDGLFGVRAPLWRQYLFYLFSEKPQSRWDAEGNWRW